MANLERATFAGGCPLRQLILTGQGSIDNGMNVLGMFVQKSVLNYTDFNAACNRFYVLCNNALCKDYYVVKCTSDNKLINMFKSYLYYYKSPYEMNITKDNGKKNTRHNCC